MNIIIQKDLLKLKILLGLSFGFKFFILSKQVKCKIRVRLLIVIKKFPPNATQHRNTITITVAHKGA